MDFILSLYRNPIFGILVIVLLVFIIAISHYVWVLYSKNKQSDKIKKFIEQFSHENKDFINLTDEQKLFLANSFFKTQNYQKALDIYLSVNVEDSDIFYNIAYSKYKLGLFGDSIKFLEFALKSRPRNKKSLKFLKYIYFKQFNFEKCLEILECLSVLEDNQKEEEFLKRYAKEPYIAHTKSSLLTFSVPNEYKSSIFYTCKACSHVEINDFFYCSNCFEYKTSKIELRISDV